MEYILTLKREDLSKLNLKYILDQFVISFLKGLMQWGIYYKKKKK